MSLRLSKPEFERLVEAALREMPPRFRRFLRDENVHIVVMRRPALYQLREQNLNPATDTLYGLYEGIPRTERVSSYNLAMPDKITIFQEPLEDDYPNRAVLKEQVRRTVLHEVAHFFGYSDAELDAMGWA
jgi:predicted Zn-dependent protease with MMP-like domain